LRDTAARFYEAQFQGEQAERGRDGKQHGQGGGELDEKGSPIEGAGMRWAKPLEGMDKAIYADINYLQARSACRTSCSLPGAW